MPAWKELLRPFYLRCVYFPLHPQARPEAFRRCWHFPAAGPIPTGRPAVLFFPLIDWHQRLQRTQHLARALARRGHTCFYASHHFGRQFPTLYPLDRAPRLTTLEPGIHEFHTRLPLEPVFHHRRLSAPETASLHRDWSALLARVRPSRAVQLVSLPTWKDLVLRLRQTHGYPVIYDCHDLLEGFSNFAPELVADERELMRQADHVLFSSAALRDHHLAQAPELAARSLLVPNATAFPVTPPAPRAARPRVGYVGAMEAWFDADAVRAAALAHPGYDFLLIGRVENPHAAQLASLPNVYLLGELPHAELPALLATFDAALIPFRVNALTRATNPVKLYEYFAFGLPVVAAPLPELDPFRDLLYTAATPEEYAAQVRAAVQEQSPERQASRQSIAARETWDHRAALLPGT